MTLTELNKILAVKLIIVIVAKGCDLAAGTRYDAFALTKSALDVIVSALHMARQRATVETFALLRVALESGSTENIWILYFQLSGNFFKTLNEVLS